MEKEVGFLQYFLYYFYLTKEARMSMIIINKQHIDTRTLCDEEIKVLPVTIGEIDFFPELNFHYEQSNSTVPDFWFKIHTTAGMPLYHFVKPNAPFKKISAEWKTYLESARTAFVQNKRYSLFTPRTMEQLYTPLFWMAESDAAVKDAGFALLEKIRQLETSR